MNFLDFRETTDKGGTGVTGSNCDMSVCSHSGSGGDTAVRDNLKIASMALINALICCGEGEVKFLFTLIYSIFQKSYPIYIIRKTLIFVCILDESSFLTES